MRPFLTAEWRWLAMLNFRADPAALRPLVPVGTDLDVWQGNTFVSLVGFLFEKTRTLGVAVPFHQDFEEVNLRFYVRRKVEDGWRRGVVFVKEIVPKRAVAMIARLAYGENYVALPMRHRISGSRVEYGWKTAVGWSGLSIEAAGEPALPEKGSTEEFITEHYWGYTVRRGGGAAEYRVEHPQWRVWRADAATLDGDVAAFYGPQFAEALVAEPHSAFLADGSRVKVYPGRRLRITEPPP